jgi:putative N6-adenine-specific DNA methylase
VTGTTSYRFFVQCALGLEALLQGELEGFGIRARLCEGGVECRGEIETLHRVCLSSRLAESVRLRLKEFEASDFKVLEEETRKMALRAYLAPCSTVVVKVVCHASRLWHSKAVQERVENSLRDHAGLRIAAAPGIAATGDNAATVDIAVPSVHQNAHEQKVRTHNVFVRVDNNRVQISLEAAGRLHRRGYRTHAVKASLRETLAAALVLSVKSELHPRANGTLWDPFCGAGTVALEALSWARGILPGVSQTHAFTHFRNFDEHAFGLLKERIENEARAAAPYPELRAVLSDRSAAALSAARHNAEQAELLQACAFELGDVAQVAPRILRGAFVITNPPYGKRLQEAGAIKSLLRLLENREDLNPVVVLAGGAARQLIPKNKPALFRTKNGGLSVSGRLLQASTSSFDAAAPSPQAE